LLQQESDLVDWIRYRATMGQAPTRKIVANKVMKLAVVNKNPFESFVAHGWFDSFFSRHPFLRSVVGARVERLHASGANADIIGRFFHLLENLLEVPFPLQQWPFSLSFFSLQKYPYLKDSPDLWWNFDESCTLLFLLTPYFTEILL
jgi:hypothetical protein